MQTKETVTITRIYTTDKDKLGAPLMSKQGKPYTRMSILTDQFGDKVWLGGFKNKTTEGWKVGDKVEILVGKTTGKNGVEYLNFDIPKFDKTDELNNRMMEVLILLRQIAEKVGVEVYGKPDHKTDTLEYPDDEINVEDIPF